MYNIICWGPYNSVLSISFTCNSIFVFFHFTPPGSARSDHARKIELIRYLMSGYVHGQVLDTLSEHANALASTAVASLEEGADELCHFPFLPIPNCPVFRVPRHDGWFRVDQISSVLCFNVPWPQWHNPSRCSFKYRESPSQRQALKAFSSMSCFVSSPLFGVDSNDS